MAEKLSTLSFISFIIAGISLILAVFFFFYFKIPAVYGDLSGRTAKKSIKKARLRNEQAGKRSYDSSRNPLLQEEITEKMPETGVDQETELLEEARPETGLLTDQRKDLPTSDATMLLKSAPEEEEKIQVKVPPKREEEDVQIKMLEEKMLIHTQEKIDLDSVL